MTTMTQYTVKVPTSLERRRALRVKIKSLAAEARIIRREEERARAALARLRQWVREPREQFRNADPVNDPGGVVESERRAVHVMQSRVELGTTRLSLREHRIGAVRTEARHAQLAYAMIRGLPYCVVEPEGKAPRRDLFGVPRGIDLQRLTGMVLRFGMWGMHRAAVVNGESTTELEVEQCVRLWLGLQLGPTISRT